MTVTGKAIDRWALTALCAVGVYLFYLNAGLAIPVSAVLGFATVALLRYLWERRPGRGRVTSGQARAALTRIAMMDEAEAVEALAALTGASDFIPVLRRPDATLSADGLFDLWRAHRGEATMTVVATCRAAPEAVALAGTLTAPTCVLIDRSALMKAIRATGRYVPPAAPPEPFGRRLRRAAAKLKRPASLRVALYGLSLLGMYLLTGRAPYLFCGLLLVGAAGMNIIHT